MEKFFLSKFLGMINLVLFIAIFAGWSKLNALPSGQTDRLKGAPFYKTYNKKAVVGKAATGYVAIGFDELTKSEFSYTGREKALQPLAEVMNAYLDSLGWCKRFADESLSEKGAPYAYVGSAEGEGAPPEAAMQRNEHDKYPPMIIHIRKPSKAWRTALGASVQANQVEYLLWIKLGFSEYPKADKGVFGKKVVLGTAYEESIKFLSAEDKSVEVLQVTGMLLVREGNIVRAGAEGIVAKDTPFWAQIFDVQQAMNNEALQKLLQDERREDLADKPLKWQVALRNLVAQLLAQPAWIIK
ncbi:MAG: hypothetical protein ACRENG_09225 [bacterium]